MRLTNAHRDAALKLLMKKIEDDHTKNCKALMSDLIKEYEASLDRDLVRCYKKHQSYFKTFEVFINKYMSAKASLPMGYNSYYRELERMPFLSKELRGKINAAKKRTDEIGDIKSKTSLTLEKYTTDKALITDFPELEKLFPANGMPTLPSIPLQEIRAELNLTN